MTCKKWSLVIIGGLLLATLACQAPATTSAVRLMEPTATGEKASELYSTQAGIANPASVHCEQNGGKLDIRSDAQGGQVGICLFPDGSECEEWAYFRNACGPGTNPAQPVATGIPAAATRLPARTEAPPAPTYINSEYGLSFNSPPEWQIEPHGNFVTFRKGPYQLFVGFQRIGQVIQPFRTGMPQGDFVEAGAIPFNGQSIPKKLLVWQGKTKLVYYGVIEAGDLRLSVWLDVPPNAGMDYNVIDIPPEIAAQGDQILSSFALRQ
jgi:putative hemolysin